MESETTPIPGLDLQQHTLLSCQVKRYHSMAEVTDNDGEGEEN
jgi:hypothetical protein